MALNALANFPSSNKIQKQLTSELGRGPGYDLVLTEAARSGMHGLGIPLGASQQYAMLGSKTKIG
jgi:hypothetical protein